MFVQGFANELSEEVKSLGVSAEVIDMKEYDPDDRLADEVSKATDFVSRKEPEMLPYVSAVAVRTGHSVGYILVTCLKCF